MFAVYLGAKLAGLYYWPGSGDKYCPASVGCGRQIQQQVLSRVQAEDRFSSQSRSLRTKHCDFVLLVTTVLQNFELLMCLMFKQRLLVTLRFARDVTFCDAAARNANGGQEMVFDRRRRLISSHYADVLRWELARVLIESPRLLLTKRKNAGS